MQSIDTLCPHTEYERILGKMEHMLTDTKLLDAARADSVFTFEKLGLTTPEARQLFDYIVGQFTDQRENRTLQQIEDAIFARFEATDVGGQTLVACLDQALASRAKLIASQVAPHLSTNDGILDMGTGDGGVSYELAHQGYRIDGAVDVTDYRKPAPDGQKPLPFQQYDGEHLPFEHQRFAQAVMTNVAHHAGETDNAAGGSKSNEPTLRELCRVTKNRIVVIETIPDPDKIKTDGLECAYERTRWNDYLYNRLFHARVNGGTVRTDIPVPGRYETAEGWVERFRTLGWRTSTIEHLRYDQESIRDYHILYVFEPDTAVTDSTIVAADTRKTADAVEDVLKRTEKNAG